MIEFTFGFLVLLAAASGAIFQPGKWYKELKRPGWTPKDWVFPAAWTVLYICIAIAGIRIYGRTGFSVVLAVWGIQLALNAAWSCIFFGMKRIKLALLGVAALCMSIAVFLLLAFPIDPISSLLFAPYLIWVSIAAALNFAIVKLNPELR